MLLIGLKLIYTLSILPDLHYVEMAHPVIDVKISINEPQELLLEKHVKFLKSFEKNEDPLVDYMRLSGIYWSLTALDLMNKLDVIDRNRIIDFVKSCQKSDGGLAPAPMHDSHLLSTLSGIQILVLLDELTAIDKEGLLQYISKLQNPDGSFNGDKWGEVDSRFSFCAIASLSLLNVLPRQNLTHPVFGIDLEMAVEFMVNCQNRDGGFGTRPGSESHAGQAYCVVGGMALLGQLYRLNIDKAAWWLAERQLPSGGLNGRPGKQPDVCYSWWVLATLGILGRLAWINSSDLAHFICASQDSDTGGISDRPGNYPDPFHTLFGLAGLSLLSHIRTSPSSSSTSEIDGKVNPLTTASTSLQVINPVLCLPQHVVDRLALFVQTLDFH